MKNLIFGATMTDGVHTAQIAMWHDSIGRDASDYTDLLNLHLYGTLNASRDTYIVSPEDYAETICYARDWERGETDDDDDDNADENDVADRRIDIRETINI